MSRSSFRILEQEKEQKQNTKIDRNLGLKFLKIDQSNVNQNQRYELNNNQTNNIIGKQTGYFARTNSLMKNFCFFTEGSYSENIKNMYDDSLVEWKKFQNSKIIEPKKIKRNSNLMTKQNLYLSLGKQKQFSLRDIQKMKKKQEEEKPIVNQQVESTDIMMVRRKSCECQQCGKLNSKQIQIQDVPFIPTQQKKFYDIKFRVSSILAAPMRQQIRTTQVKSPTSILSKSQINIPLSDQNKNSCNDEKNIEDTQRSNKQNDTIKLDISLNSSTEKQIDGFKSSNKQNVQSLRNIKKVGVQEQTSQTSIEEVCIQKRRQTEGAKRNSRFEASLSPVNNENQKMNNQQKSDVVFQRQVKLKNRGMQTLMNFVKQFIEKLQKEENQKELENGNNSQQTKADSTDLQQSDENCINQANKSSQNTQINDQSNKPYLEFSQKNFSLKRNSAGDYFKPHKINLQSLTLSQTARQIKKNDNESAKFKDMFNSFRDHYIKKYGDQEVQNSEYVKYKKMKKSSKKNDKQNQLGTSSTTKDIFKPISQSPYFSISRNTEQIQNNKKNMDLKVFTKSVLNNQNYSTNNLQTQQNFNKSSNNGQTSFSNVPSINSLTNLNQQSISANTLPTKKFTSSSCNRKRNETAFGKSTQDSQFQHSKDSNYFTTLSRRNMTSSELFQGKSAQFNKFACYLKPNTSPKFSQNILSPQFRKLQQQSPPNSAPYINSQSNQIQTSGNKNKNKINGLENQPQKKTTTPRRLDSLQNSDIQQNSVQIKHEQSGNNLNDNHSSNKSFKELDQLLDGIQHSQKKSKQASFSNTQKNNLHSNSNVKIIIRKNDKQ